MLRLSSLALLAALGFASFNLTAHAEDAPKDAPKRGHKEGGKEGRNAHMRERMHAMLFKGITLSDDQKSALKKMKEDGKKGREVAQKDGEKKKGERPDPAKRLDAIRAILTADQVKVFDENIKQMEAKRAEMKEKGRKGDGERDGKPEGKRKGKPERKPKAK